MRSSLDIGFELDRQWFWLRGEMDKTKKPALAALLRVLASAHVPYAVIGGIAVQVHRAEPRTTIDIDVAVPERSLIPASALEQAGFSRTGVFEHSENWRSADGIPIQFTDDVALRGAIARASVHAIDDLELRVIQVGDLLHAKLRAVADPSRRRSKRLQDLADVEALLEERPELQAELSEIERAILITGATRG